MIVSSYGITFDGTVARSFGDDYAKNVVICAVDDSLSHTVDLILIISTVIFIVK